MKKGKLLLVNVILAFVLCLSMSIQMFAVEGVNSEEVLEEAIVDGSVSAAGIAIEPALISIFPSNSVFADVLGDGSERNPFRITKKEHFALMEEESSSHFRLMNNIDLGNVPWTPISYFGGTFDGGGKTISNLKIYLPNQNDVGFFSDSDGNLYNITLNNVDITGNSSVGALIGTGSNPNVDSCTITGTSKIRGQRQVGGIMGFADGGDITFCEVNADVSGTEGVGGLIGDFSDDDIYLDYNTVNGNITGDYYVGGLTGDAWKDGDFEVNNCTVNGTVQGIERVGGFFGRITSEESTSFTVKDCYMYAEVSGDFMVDRIIGDSWLSTITLEGVVIK